MCLLLVALFLLVGESLPALSKLLSNSSERHVRVLLDDDGACFLAEEHVAADLLLAASGLLLWGSLSLLWWHRDGFRGKKKKKRG